MVEIQNKNEIKNGNFIFLEGLNSRVEGSHVNKKII